MSTTYPPVIAPSVLAANHANLAEGMRTINASGVPWVHLDIMDGHFVPNLSFGPQVVADLRPLGTQYFDTHLMLDNPHKYVEAFAKAGSQNITVHVEPEYPIMETLDHIRALGCDAGICINPGTPVEALLPYLEKVQLVLLMSVQPGFGGQSFRREVLGKIATLDGWRKARGLSLRIEVDGGINADTGRECREAGADTFVCGTAFFKAPDKRAFVEAICG